MAIYHCTVNVISRGKGGNSIAAAAYRSGELVYDERLDVNHDYTRKTGIDYTEIITPDNTPEDYYNREILWNAVEQAEKRKDARVAREVEVALPRELSNNEKVKLVQDYAKVNFVENGMIADIAIHKINGSNPHAHIMLTTREVTKEGFNKKNRDWDNKERLQEWRKSWAELSNQYLEKNHYWERIDHRSYKDQGIDKIPMLHLNKDVVAMERKGIRTELGNYNRLVKELNKRFIAIKSFFKAENSHSHQEITSTQRMKEEEEKREYYAAIRNIEYEKRDICTSLGDNPLQKDYRYNRFKKELREAEQKEQEKQQDIREHQEAYEHRSIFKKMFGIGNKAHQLALESKGQSLREAQKEKLMKERQLTMYEDRQLKALEKQRPSLEQEKKKLEERQQEIGNKIKLMDKDKEYKRQYQNEYKYSFKY